MDAEEAAVEVEDKDEDAEDELDEPADDGAVLPAEGRLTSGGGMGTTWELRRDVELPVSEYFDSEWMEPESGSSLSEEFVTLPSMEDVRDDEFRFAEERAVAEKRRV